MAQKIPALSNVRDLLAPKLPVVLRWRRIQALQDERHCSVRGYGVADQLDLPFLGTGEAALVREALSARHLSRLKHAETDVEVVADNLEFHQPKAVGRC